MKKMSMLGYKANLLLASAATAMMPITALATEDTKNVDPNTGAEDVIGLSSVSKPIVDLINSLIGPALAIVGALGTLFCIILGVKYAKAEEPQDREKAKSHLKNAIIGFVLIFVLILALRILMPNLEKWAYTTGVETAASGT